MERNDQMSEYKRLAQEEEYEERVRSVADDGYIVWGWGGGLVHKTACISNTGVWIASTAIVGPNVTIGHLCEIGEYVTINQDCHLHKGVVIDKHTILEAGVQVDSGVEIGAYCHIYPISQIDYEAKLSDHVILGAHCNVGEGTRIGHDSQIGEWCQIDSHVVVGANVKVGEGCHLWPGSVIHSRAELPDDTEVLIGEHVYHSVKDYREHIVISIYPHYAQQIFNGTKTVEFRKKVPLTVPGTYHLYVPAPADEIVGEFESSTYVRDTPEVLWEKYKMVGGITAEDFFAYYKDVEYGVALIIDTATRYNEPKELKEYGLTDPPKGYCVPLDGEFYRWPTA